MHSRQAGVMEPVEWGEPPAAGAPDSGGTGQKRQGREIRRAAMNMLARRENSFKELDQKLARRFPEQGSLIRTALEELAADGLQSDLRFAESYLRSRAARGFGEVRIALELAQKGIADAVVRQAMASVAIDWDGLLEDQFHKKCRSQPPATVEEKAKLLRFFQHRGFAPDQVRRLLRK